MVPRHPLSKVPHLPANCGDAHVYGSQVHVPVLQVKGNVQPQFRSGSPQPCGTVVPHWLPQLPLGVQHVVPLQTWPPVHVLHVIFPPVMQTLSTVVLHAPAAQFASAQHEPAVPLGAGLPGGPPTMQL